MEDNARPVTPFQFLGKAQLAGMKDFTPHPVDSDKEPDPKGSSAAESATSSRSETTQGILSSETEETLAPAAKGKEVQPTQAARSTRPSLPSPRTGKNTPPAEE